MKRLLVVLLLLNPLAVKAVPVVPNFLQGSLTSHTETTQKITENIVSIDYNMGWQYSVSGVNVENSGTSISPDSTSLPSTTLQGVTSTWTGLNASQKPDWSITTPGAAFQFTETYSGPGISQHTIITRTTDVTSVTDTTSIFSK